MQNLSKDSLEISKVKDSYRLLLRLVEEEGLSIDIGAYLFRYTITKRLSTTEVEDLVERAKEMSLEEVRKMWEEWESLYAKQMGEIIE